jgi:hypothetical protein
MSHVTVARLERALAAIAHAMILDGPVYAPVLERLELELAKLQAGEDALSRARRYHLGRRVEAQALRSKALKP